MLKTFNGAELFNNCGPLVTIFGISQIPPLPPLEWAPDWYVDKFTPAWREFSGNRDEWAIAMMNYGGLIVLSRDGSVREWDTSERCFSPWTLTVEAWINQILREGEEFMKT